MFHADEHPLPPHTFTQFRVGSIKPFGLGDHLAPPRAAWRTARFTATLASCILYPFRLRPFAPRTAASPAAFAVSSLIALPARACPAASAIQGTGATCPITIFAVLTSLPFISRTTEAAASGQSSASFCLTS